MLQRYGEFAARRAKVLLVVAALFMIAAGMVGSGAFGQLKNGGFQDANAESTRAEQMIDAHFGGQTNLVLLVTARAGSVDGGAVADAGRQLTTGLAGEAGVTDVVSYWTTGGIAIMGTFAELAILGSVTDVSIFSINLTTALGLGLGIDYGLFMVSRFREQLGRGDSVPEAVARTVATAGRTVVFSAAAVI